MPLFMLTPFSCKDEKTFIEYCERMDRDFQFDENDNTAERIRKLNELTEIWNKEQEEKGHDG